MFSMRTLTWAGFGRLGQKCNRNLDRASLARWIRAWESTTTEVRSSATLRRDNSSGSPTPARPPRPIARDSRIAGARAHLANSHGARSRQPIPQFPRKSAISRRRLALAPRLSKFCFHARARSTVSTLRSTRARGQGGGLNPLKRREPRAQPFGLTRRSLRLRRPLFSLQPLSLFQCRLLTPKTNVARPR